MKTSDLARNLHLSRRRPFAFLVLALTLAAAGCSSEARDEPSAALPKEVGFVTVTAETVPLTAELVGRTAAFETSEVRPQVSGLVLERLFKEGAEVRRGQTLYQIDPSLFEAAVAEAKANVENARAAEERARGQADRLRPLAERGVTSAQAFDDVQAAARTAAATLAQADAQLRTAEINLRFSRVAAPIDGRIGRSLFTTGALVSAGQAEPLATIQRLDPIFVDIQQSSASLLELRRQLAAGQAAAEVADVRLKLEDGSDYPLGGTLQFTEVTVSPDTATVTVRAKFPNPDGLLLPGMYVRAVVSQSQVENAMLVPQQGIARTVRGEATALVVGTGEKVERRTVQVARAVGNRWLVTEGLRPGDRLIVEGTMKTKPGEAVRAVAATGPNLGGQADRPVARTAQSETSL